MRVGFIGTGNMGAPMAANILAQIVQIVTNALDNLPKPT